jgi:folate-binding protein YgfZ
MVYGKEQVVSWEITLNNLDRVGLIAFTGDDAQAFLHSQLSCDVSELSLNRSTYGSYCTPRGRVLATFVLWRSAQGFFMQLPSPLRESIQKGLSKYILRSKVKATDESAAYARFAIAGDGAEALLKRLFGDAPGSVHEVQHTASATLIRLPVDRFEIVAPREKAAALGDALADESRAADPRYWDWLEIRAGIPVITPATQEEFVPQMVNLDVIGGVSLTKGCYPGQEIVARMHYLGRLKQRMYLANLAGDAAPQPGDRLYSTDMGDQASGTVVNAAPSPDGGHDLLAVIQMSSAESGAIHWKGQDGPELRFLKLPYQVDAKP